MDNQILVYSTDNFRQNRKKRFAGHAVAGYACQVGFSPDGKWISSGDGEGNVVFWDWRTGRIKSRLRAHSKVVIAHEWLPHETVCYLAFLVQPHVNDRTSLVKSCHRILGWAYQALGGFNLLHCLMRDVLANQVVGLTHWYLALRSCTTLCNRGYTTCLGDRTAHQVFVLMILACLQV